MNINIFDNQFYSVLNMHLTLSIYDFLNKIFILNIDILHIYLIFMLVGYIVWNINYFWIFSICVHL